MRDNVPSQFTSTARSIKARLLCCYDHNEFSQFPAQETPVTFAQFSQYAVFVESNYRYDVVQYGSAAGGNSIYKAAFNPSWFFEGDAFDRGFTVQPYTYPAGATSEDDKALSGCDGALFCAVNGKVFQLNGVSWTLLADFKDMPTNVIPQISLAAISPTLVVVAAVYAGTSIYDRCELSVIDNGVVDTWKGYLPKHSTKPGLTAAKLEDGTVYIYVDDWSGKKPVCIRRFASTLWSATKEILPTDVLDEDSIFKVGHACLLRNGRLFLTGVLKRQYGATYSIYMLGPDHFTFGRELVIAADYDKPFLIIFTGGDLWAIGQDKFYTAPWTGGKFFVEDDANIDSTIICRFDGNLMAASGQLPVAVGGVPTFVPGKFNQGVKINPGEYIKYNYTRSPTYGLGLSFWTKDVVINSATDRYFLRVEKDSQNYLMFYHKGGQANHAGVVVNCNNARTASFDHTTYNTLAAGLHHHVIDLDAHAARWYIDGQLFAEDRSGSFIPGGYDYAWLANASVYIGYPSATTGGSLTIDDLVVSAGFTSDQVSLLYYQGYPYGQVYSIVDALDFNANFTANQADTLSLNVKNPWNPYGSASYLIEPGSRVDLQVAANDSEWYTLGSYGVDRVRETNNEAGRFFQVDCSSYALKKLMDWESDTYIDYMGQAEVHGDPGDLTKIVGVTGQKYDRTNGLTLQSLNDSGILYTVPAASHGGFIRCQFTNVQPKDNLIGVGLNYSEETLAEAAARLGKKIEDTTAAERGRWALIAIYNPDPYGGTAGKGRVYMFDYNTLRIDNGVLAPWLALTYVDVDRPAAGDGAWLGMQYQDGYVRVYYRNSVVPITPPSSEPSMKLVISRTAVMDWETHKVEHLNFGRGAIFLRNNTGYHMAYPFMSDSDVIPLYEKAEKYAYGGVPIEDRPDKFPASGSVIVDSERIGYTGLAGFNDVLGNSTRHTTDLDWVPGKVLCQSADGVNDPGGVDAPFAQTRGYGSPHVHGNNYLLQNFPTAIPAGETITAVRVWLKAYNYPEDSVTLTINVGRVYDSNAAIALVNNVKATGYMAPGSKLSSAGSWVTFYLSSDVIVDQAVYDAGLQYWIMIRRNTNPNHPSSTSYFMYRKLLDNSLGNAGAWVFCEEDDQVVGQTGDMAFVLYGKVEGVNKEFCIPVKFNAAAGLPAAWGDQNYFLNCALVASAGSGVNNAFRIVRAYRYTAGVNDLYLFFASKNPGKIFDIGTKLRAVPAFYGLTRGQNSTTAAAHGNHSYVHVPPTAYDTASYFEYFTAEEDQTLAEVAESITRKAGVIDVDKCNRLKGIIDNGSGEVVQAQSKNMIVTLQVPEFTDGNYVRLNFNGDQGTDFILVQLSYDANFFGANTGMVDVLSGKAGVGQVLALRLPFDERVKGDFRVSLYDGHVGIWCGGRLLGAAVIDPSALPDWTYLYIETSFPSTNPVKVLIPQAGTRVDNFVMDMGKTGSQLLSSLIGEKRVYFRDDGKKGLKIYTDRTPASYSYGRAAEIAIETTDIGLATRVLLEGGEVVEVSSAGNLNKYGNIFKTFNFNEINNLEDAAYFADKVLEDMSLNREHWEVTGAADPRVEPADCLYILSKNSSGVPYNQEIVVDAVSHSMTISETDAVYDMRISGRRKAA